MKNKKIFLVLFFVFSFFTLMPSVNALSGKVTISGSNNYDYVKEVVSIMNEERAKDNLTPLVLDEALTEKAMIRSNEIAYLFSHTRPNNTNCVTVLDGVAYNAFDENIAYGQSSPSSVMTAWMNSTGHMNNIMAKTDASKEFKAVGIGHSNINGVNYWVQLFSDTVNNELVNSGASSFTNSIDVEIDDDVELDFSPSMSILFDEGVTLNKNNYPTHTIFSDSKPIVKVNGWDVDISDNTISYKSNDENVVFAGAYGNLIAKNNGSTTVEVTIDNRNYTMPVTVEGFSGEIETINRIVVNNATLEFNEGDTPKFTGESGSDKYVIFEEWWEEVDENNDNPKSTLSNDNKLEKFEAGKKYSYNVSFEINPSCGMNCYFDYSADVIINNRNYGKISGGDADGKTFIVNAIYIINIAKPQTEGVQTLTHFVVNNATLDVNTDEDIVFTATTDSNIYDIYEYWAQDGEVFLDSIMLKTDPISNFQNSKKMWTGTRYYYYIGIKIKDEYKNQYQLPTGSSKDIPVSLILNGKKYSNVEWYVYRDRLVLADLYIVETVPDGTELVILDHFDFDDATITFNAGDEPIFTGKTSNEGYTTIEMWEEYFRYDDRTGGINKRITSSEEDNKWYDELIEKFEPGKRYNYSVGFYINNDNYKETGIFYMLPVRRENITLNFNGKEYKIKSDMDFYFYFDDLYLDIPYVIDNATLEIKDGDEPTFTGYYDTQNYNIIESWTEYTNDEGHEYDDNYWKRNGISSSSDLNSNFKSNITKFEAGKKYSYSVRFEVNSPGGEGREFYIQKGQTVKILVNGKEYNYTFTSDNLTWGVKDLFVIEIPSINVPITDLTLNKSEVVLTEGETDIITVEVLPENTTDSKTLTWTSNDTNIATVDNGTIKGINPGETTVTVKSVNGVEKTITVKVNKKLIPITDLVLNKTEVVLTEGETDIITVEVLPENTTDSKTLTWTSNDTNIATVDNGTIKGINPGETTVTVKSVNGVEKTITVKVNKKLIPITDLALNKTEVVLTEGETDIITVEVLPENTTDSKTLTWTSNDTNIATVDNGTIKGINPGETTVTVKSVNGVEKTITVKVNKKLIPITDLVLNKTEVVLTEGETDIITVEVLPENTTDSKTLTWTSNNTNIATVDNGTIKGINPGETTVTVKSVNGVEKTITVKVNKKLIPITDLTLNKSEVVLTEGETDIITVEVLPENTTDSKTLTWTSNDTNIATVDNGTIKGINPGETTVTVKSVNGVEKTITVKVNKKLIPITDLVLNKTEVVLTEGETDIITVEVLPENTTDSKTLTWTSNDTNIATVDNGTIKGINPGETTVTVKSVNGVEKTITVKVNKKLIPITDLTLNKTEVVLTEGETDIITVEVLPENTSDSKTLTWTSNDTNIATVDNGTIKGINPGETTVTVKSVNGVEKTITVKVNKKLIQITDLALNKTEVVLTEGETDIITVEVLPENTTDSKTLTWTSNNTNIATVDNGTIKGINPGETTVTVKSINGVEKTITVKVNKKLIPLTSISLSQNNAEISDILYLMINSYEPSDIPLTHEIVWSSSNEAVAVVTDEGMVIPISIGEAYITVSVGDVSDTCYVVVTRISNDLLGFIIDGNNKKYYNNQTVSKVGEFSDDLTIEFTDDIKRALDFSSEDKTINWISSDENILKVDSNGHVTSLKNGKAYVYAQFGGYKTARLYYDRYDVITNFQKTIYVGDTEKLDIRYKQGNTTYRDMSYFFIENNEIVSIDNNGVLTGLKPGKTKVTAIFFNNNNVRFDFEIEVLEREKNIFEVEFEDDNQTITVRNSNGMVILVIDNITNEVVVDNMPKLEDKEFVELYNIYYKLGDNSTFENPIYIVRVPITFDINNYTDITIVYIKDGKIIEEVDSRIIDNKYIEFTTSHFSNYAVYAKLKDRSNEISIKTNSLTNPKTSTIKEEDNSYIFMILIIQYISLLLISKYKTRFTTYSG